MVIRRGEIWWASLPEAVGSGPGFRRPVVIIQSNELNQTGIRTVIAAILTTNLRWASGPGNVFVPRSVSHLPRDSVVNVTQLYTIDREALTDRVATLPPEMRSRIDDGLRLVLSL